MGRLIWLASYPKSGNTWVRAFLANLLGDSGRPADINRLGGSLSQGESALGWYRILDARPVETLDRGGHRAAAPARPRADRGNRRGHLLLQDPQRADRGTRPADGQHGRERRRRLHRQEPARRHPVLRRFPERLHRPGDRDDGDAGLRDADGRAQRPPTGWEAGASTSRAGPAEATGACTCCATRTCWRRRSTASGNSPVSWT